MQCLCMLILSAFQYYKIMWKKKRLKYNKIYNFFSLYIKYLKIADSAYLSLVPTNQKVQLRNELKIENADSASPSPNTQPIRKLKRMC